MEKKIPKIRVVKRTYYGPLAKKGSEWIEVQYFSEPGQRWRGYTQYGSVITFKTKSEAMDFCLRKKAGVPTNNYVTEIIA